MRFYFVGENDTVLDLFKTKKIDERTFEYKIIDPESKNESCFILKKLANKFYLSYDGLAFKKLGSLSNSSSVLHINQHLKIFCGFKPSTFSSGAQGDLVTQMPGKVVKIMTIIGKKVMKGDILVILEAMKMENEIKAGRDGMIRAIHITEGQALDAGFNMMEIEVMGE